MKQKKEQTRKLLQWTGSNNGPCAIVGTNFFQLKSLVVQEYLQNRVKLE